MDLETRIREICEVSRGHVSVELTTETEREMLAESLRYYEWNKERICVKVPFSCRIPSERFGCGVSTTRW